MNNKICAEIEEDRICSINSGDGLVTLDITDANNPRYRLIGIASHGYRECIEHDYPVIYTDFDKYTKWIEMFRQFNSHDFITDF